MRTWRSRFIQLSQERADEVATLRRRLVDQQRDYEEQIHELHKEIIQLRDVQHQPSGKVFPMEVGVIEGIRYIEPGKEKD